MPTKEQLSDHERLSAENARLRGLLEAAERDMRRPAVRVVPGSFVSGGIRVSISAESPTPGAPYYVQLEHEGHMISLSREGARLMCLAILGAM